MSTTTKAIFVFTLLLASTQALETSSPQAATLFSSLGYSVYTVAQDIRDTPRKRAKRPEYVAHPASDLICRPFGECEACPDDELDQPFCLPFGNRRLLHCIPAAQAHMAEGGSSDNEKQPAGEVPAWESCGRVVKKERQDYWEFVTANLLFLIVALTVLWARTSALASAQYRQLAARIGIPGGTWRT